MEAEEDEKITCWCAAEGCYDQLFESNWLDTRCRGTGVLYCHCGGDLCVCHHHGEVDCYGCADCESDDEYYLYDEDQ